MSLVGFVSLCTGNYSGDLTELNCNLYMFERSVFNYL